MNQLKARSGIIQLEDLVHMELERAEGLNFISKNFGGQDDKDQKSWRIRYPPKTEMFDDITCVFVGSLDQTQVQHSYSEDIKSEIEREKSIEGSDDFSNDNRVRDMKIMDVDRFFEDMKKKNLANVKFQFSFKLYILYIYKAFKFFLLFLLI